MERDEQADFVVAPRDVEPDAHAPEGWSRAMPEHLPRPTYWPAVLAVGVTMIAWGLAASLLITLVGLIVLGIAVWGWIGELRHGG